MEGATKPRSANESSFFNHVFEPTPGSIAPRAHPPTTPAPTPILRLLLLQQQLLLHSTHSIHHT